MPVRLSDADRELALASLRAYAEDLLEMDLGRLRAGALLDFILEEIGPSIYNSGVADAQERLHARVTELDLEVHEPPFPHSPRHR